MGYNWSGSLDNENSSASVNIVFSNSNRATDGDVYDTTMRIDRSFNYNAGTIHINASGIKVLDINTGNDVQEFTSIGTISVGDSSKRLEVGGSVSFDINYHMGSSITIAFNCSLNSSSWEIYAGTITASWSGVSNNCSYSFKSDNSFSYTGSSQTILNSYEEAYLIASGQSAIEVGDYTCTLKVKSQYKATHCLRDLSGLMTDSVSQIWHITKTTPDWSISPLTTNIKIGETGRVTISGTFTGIKSVEQSSPDGGEVSLLGLNGNQYSFNGTKSGTVLVKLYSKENEYYETDNREFTVIVSKNKEDQHWYYSNKTITVGMTTYINREGYNISSATPEFKIGDSNIISATINNSDGQLTVIGKAIGTSKLTVKIPADENYNEHSNEITITVIGKKEQPWNSAYGNEITIEPNGDYYISIFGSVYGGIDYRTESSIIDISNKSERGCKITSNGTTGIATVSIYSPGNEEYNEKTIRVTVTVIKNLQWIQINPYIYINNQWTELNPKIYKSGKWLPGTIWKYISKGDIYGK